MNSTLLALLRNPETPLWVIKEACMDADLRSVWAVQYCYGEYSGYREKHIGVFLDKEQAKEWMEKVRAEYTEKRQWWRALEDGDEEVRDLYWKLYDNKDAVLESCSLVGYATYEDYSFRIIEIPLRCE